MQNAIAPSAEMIKGLPGFDAVMAAACVKHGNPWETYESAKSIMRKIVGFGAPKSSPAWARTSDAYMVAIAIVASRIPGL